MTIKIPLRLSPSLAMASIVEETLHNTSNRLGSIEDWLAINHGLGLGVRLSRASVKHTEGLLSLRMPLLIAVHLNNNTQRRLSHFWCSKHC